MQISKENLGLAAEFATASELCKRGIYAQLTLGLRKRTDLLIETEKGMLRVQVKGKQKREWPKCEGIDGKGIVIVFVDFQNKLETQRPDFYILTVDDWKKVLDQELRQTGKVAKGQVIIDDRNIPTWIKKGANGKVVKWVGTHIRPKMIEEFKEQWDKISDNLL